VGGVSQYDVGAGDALAPKATPTVMGGTSPYAIGVSPDGKSVYVTNSGTNGAGGISQYDVGVGGALTPKTPATVAGGDGPYGLVVLPDQGPVAAFMASVAPAGSASSFDGSTSSDSDGTVVRYDWSFGDGASALDAGPTPTHTYRAPGPYTVTLKVTDNAGCSNVFVFTGQTAYCNAGPMAIIAHQIAVAKPAPPGAKIIEAKINSKHHRAEFAFKALGVGSGFQCALVKKPKKHHKKPTPHFARCSSPKTYKHLKVGSYTFEVRALGAGGPGKPAGKNFKIT
jgi:hypothetical protein